MGGLDFGAEVVGESGFADEEGDEVLDEEVEGLAQGRAGLDGLWPDRLGQRFILCLFFLGSRPGRSGHFDGIAGGGEF